MFLQFHPKEKSNAFTDTQIIRQVIYDLFNICSDLFNNVPQDFQNFKQFFFSLMNEQRS